MKRIPLLVVGVLFLGVTACGGSGAGSAATDSLGLFRPQGDLSSRPGIEDVSADTNGDVTSFVLDFPEAEGKKVPLAQAQKETLSYLPVGATYGASITQTYCKTYTVQGTKATANVSFYTADPADPTPIKFGASQIAVAVVVDRDVTQSHC